jgi:hypothetical protein
MASAPLRPGPARNSQADCLAVDFDSRAGDPAFTMPPETARSLSPIGSVRAHECIGDDPLASSDLLLAVADL